MSDYDVIIVGAGHNGLTAAVELSRAGKKVLVLEKTALPGGMACTKEIFPGFKHSVGAWAMIVLKEKMVKYLELEKEGFELIRPESSYTVFGDEGDTPFIGYCDPMEMANHMVEDHGFEAMQGFQDLARYFVKWKEMFDHYADQPNPPTMEQMIAETQDEETREALMTLTYSSAMEVLRKFFPNEGEHGTILASLCASAIDGTHYGPYSKGSALSLSYHYCAGDSYDFKIPRGGMGNFSAAIAAVAQRYGAEIRYKTPIEKFVIEHTPQGNTVSGVRMKDGEIIRAKKVISTLDAHSTFIRLGDRSMLPGDFARAIDDIDYTMGYMQIHLTLKDLPTFRNQLAFVNGTTQRWLVAYLPSPEHLHEAWCSYKNDQVPDSPAVYCYFPSMLDSSLAPEGYHTCTLFSHYFPAHTAKGEHKAMKKLMAERMLNCIEDVAPGFRESIMDQAVFTQHYFETNYGATGGDFAQGMIHPGQFFGDRPVPGWVDQNASGYQTPLLNLFTACGGNHPGPGVTCLPGLYGARVVLAELESEQPHNRESATAEEAQA
jgi:phytoene dehydrogenase-like protein